MIKYKKNLFIHDYFQNYGGGERLILDQIKKEDDLLTSFAEKNLKKKIKTKKIIFLQNNQNNILIKKILTPILFSLTRVKKEYDNYFISGNYSVFCKFPKNSNKIFYCHSLPKIFFNYKNFYNDQNISIRILILILGYIFKFFYIKRLNNFEKIIVNSKYTKKKLSNYTKKKIEVIYPPIKNFHLKKKKIKKKFFLSNSRHEIEKNIDIAIKVFKKINKYNLIICSTGSQSSKLKLISKGNDKIKFIGLVNEKKYKRLLNESIATINLGKNEDFGMSAIEGMSAGKPAIVLNDGGYLETCKDGFNSFVLNKRDIKNDLFKLLKYFNLNKSKKMEKNCLATAKKFHQKIFTKKINKLFI